MEVWHAERCKPRNCVTRLNKCLPRRSILDPLASDKLDKVGRSSNGKTAASGAAYRGSNPCLPANPFKNVMRFHAILLLAAPLLSFAQAPSPTPPPQVDQALRTRAKAFLQYQKDGDFHKAYEMVAEDSKDY